MISLQKIKSAFFDSRLRNKFSLFFIVLVAVPIILFGGTTLYSIEMAHRRDVASLEQNLIDQKIKEIQKFMADTLGIIDVRVGFTQRSEIALSEQGFLLEGILAEADAIESARLISLSGMETAKTARRESDGQLADVSRLPLYTVPKIGSRYVSEPRQTLDGPFITIAAPVYNRNNEMIQILAADVNLSEVLRSVYSARIGSTGTLLLVDGTGRLLSQSPQGQLRPGENIAATERVAAVLSGKALSGLDSRDRYIGYASGVPVVGAAKRIPGLGWGMFAEWPLSDADEVIAGVRSQVFSFTFASILIVLILAPLFAARFVRPIRELEIGAREIEKGNFKKKVNIETGDELEELGATFNEMGKGLERLQELRNEFVYIVTHELRSPVTAIRGYLSMLREGSFGAMPDKVAQTVGVIGKASDNLAELINDLLEVARFEAGQVKLETQTTDIRALVKEVCTTMQPVAAGAGVSITAEEGAPLAVRADPGRLRQVITNLVSNAIKYNRANGMVALSYKRSGAMLLVTVADTGIGLSPDDRAHLFEKFFRAKTAKEIGGTGLGLYITREFIRAMGGDIILVESAEGKGTSFTWSVPLAA